MNKTLDTVILRYVGFGLLFLSVAVGLYLVRGALPVFVIGGVIAYALEPVLQKLEKRGHSRRGAVGVVFGFYI
jgi:predicted PurR-regulated permease PerM